MEKYIYHFTQGSAEGDMTMSDLLGGKGANLAQMCNLNLPIPSGFTISTALCQKFLNRSAGTYNKAIHKADIKVDNHINTSAPSAEETNNQSDEFLLELLKEAI